MDRNKEEGPVAVPAGVLEGIEAVRRVSTANMLDRAAVAGIARALGHIATGDWVRANPTAYAEGVFRGFAAVDPWSAPLIDDEAVEGFHSEEVADDDDGPA